MLRIVIMICFVLPTDALADVWTFETPSENIQCVVGQGDDDDFSDITCTIINRSGAFASPKPANCNQDWGHTFFMYGRGPVEPLCEKLDRSKEGFSRAEYGVTGNFGGFTCQSSKSGFKCTNLDGNGFFLSRKQQSLFGDVKTERANNSTELEISSSNEDKLLSIVGEEVASGCKGRGGTFKAKGIIEIDLNADGVDDLVLAHQNLECNGTSSLSSFCGTQVCSIKTYLFTNDNYRKVDEILGRITGYSWSPEPVFEIMGHGEKFTQWKPNYSEDNAEKAISTTSLKVPILERGEPDDLPTCASSAVVGVKNFLAVRSGPGSKYEKIDELQNGEIVYVFDNRGKWAGVVFRTDDVECSAKKTRKVPYERKGWVHKDWLEDLAG